MSWTRTQAEDDKQCADLTAILTALLDHLEAGDYDREWCEGCGYLVPSHAPCPHCAKERRASQ